ncbi:MAG: RICIN domain-containing protein, partial [Chloroflexota bacterium]
TGSSPSLASLYPGDAYVDWVGLDGYNDGTDTSAGYSGWQTFSQVFGYSYDALAALTQKPMMIGETASTEESSNPTVQNTASWITSAFFTEIPSRFPRLRLVIWFDQNKETDWRVNSRAAALSAYRAVVMSPLYQGQIGVDNPTPAIPTQTSTPIPPTVTSTPIPPTSTSTLVPPTLTSTSTPIPPTLTSTPVPPTQTSIPTQTTLVVPIAPRIVATRSVRLAAADIYYKIVNHRSSEDLDATGASKAPGTRIIQWINHDGWNQEWRFLPNAAGYYTLVNRNSGLVLDVPGNSKLTDIQLDQSVDSGSLSQQWRLIPVGSGWYQLVNRRSALLADADGMSQANGAPIITWPANGGWNQEWELIPASS